MQPITAVSRTIGETGNTMTDRESKFEFDAEGSFRFALHHLDKPTFSQIRKDTLQGLRAYAANIDHNPQLQQELPAILKVLNDLKPDAALTESLHLSETEDEIRRIVQYLKTYL